MAKQTLNSIAKLEKELDKLQKQLLKSHHNKTIKLEKAVKKTAGKVAKSKNKLASLSNKKTASAKGQQQSVNFTLAHLITELNILKGQFKSAKYTLKRASLIEKTAAKALKESLKPRKKILRKKVVKAIVKAATAHEPLTPDISKPVANAKKTPSKTWKPKVSVNKTATATKAKPEPKPQTTTATTPKVSPTARSKAPTKTSETKGQPEPNPVVKKAADAKAIETETTPTDNLLHKPLASAAPDTQATKSKESEAAAPATTEDFPAAAKPNVTEKEIEQPKPTNWFTTPIVKHDDS
jgi:hypothetical protein